MSPDPSPPVAVVTGASSGLGRGLALRLAADGWSVGLVARRVEALEELSREIHARGGIAAVCPCDVSDRDQVHRAVGIARSRLGSVELAVANAGISGMTTVDELDARLVARMTSVNFLGAVHLVEAVLPEMLARERGHLVAVGSLAGYGGLPKTAAYSATKGALHNFFESLRIDLRDRGVAVTTVTPGYVDTPMTELNDHPMPFLQDPDEAVDRMLRAIRQRRRHLAFPRPLSTLVWLAQLFPTRFYDFLASRQRRDKKSPARHLSDPVGAGHLPRSHRLEPSRLPGIPGMNDRVETLIGGRRERLQRLLLRALEEPRSQRAPLPEENREHLMEYARELYWNELEWENITEEEATEGGPVPELVFPGFLAYVRGLLLEEAMDDSLAPAEPRPEVARDVLRFLAGRVVELEEALEEEPEEIQPVRAELATTDHLLDLVLYLYHGLSEAEVERLEERRLVADQG